MKLPPNVLLFRKERVKGVKRAMAEKDEKISEYIGGNSRGIVRWWKYYNKGG